MRASIRRTFADPGLERLRPAVVTMTVALLSAATAAFIADEAHLSIDVVVLAVMLSLTFTAERAGRSLSARITSAIALPIIAILAGVVGAVMFAAPLVGDPLYIAAVSGAIWLRRFGPRWQRVGTLIALPFITVLVAPLPIAPGDGFAFWGALIAAVVVVWATIVRVAATAVRWLPQATSPVERSAPQRPSADRRPQSTDRRLSASTRMAAQMAVSLAIAFPLGHLVFAAHWPWVVITAYLVNSGNRGRGDVVYKGVNRVVGALGGTLVASLFALFAHPGDTGIIGLLIVVLSLALWLRPVGYGWWAAGITAALSLLYDYSGSSSGGVLFLRLIAIVAGGVVGMASAWWVLPVKTGDVLRRRTADALATLASALATTREDPVHLPDATARFEADVAQLEQIAPSLRAHRASRIRRRDRAHRADVIDAVAACQQPLKELTSSIVSHPELMETPEARRATGTLSRQVGALRRSLGGYPPDPESTVSPLMPTRPTGGDDGDTPDISAKLRFRSASVALSECLDAAASPVATIARAQPNE